MKISYDWLSSHIKSDLNVQKVSEMLTNTGLEVEAVESTGNSELLNGVIVGKVVTLEKHPNADKLKVATVDVGNEELLTIVCGAPNVAQEQKVPVATVGTVLTAPDGKPFTIGKAKLRGVESSGMICSQAELGISDNHDGIWVLEPSSKVGTPVGELIEKSDSDVMIEIGLTPNRSDAMGHFGVARDLNAAMAAHKLKAEFSPLSTEDFDALEITGENPIQVEVKNPELAPRYSGLYFENLTIKPSPEWMQNRLKTIGLNPINNVVDITNYILHDLGQPLHAFDADKIKGQKIIVQQQSKDTVFITLDGKDRKLNGSELMICDNSEGMCMAGIYGGLDSGVTETTKRIFLESAYFDPISVRKSSKFHDLNTDSSFRFERGTDPNMTIIALKKAAMLLIEYADAKIVGELTDIYPEPIENFTTVLRYHKLDQLSGERLHRELVKEILKSLDIQVLSESNETLELSIPPYRADVQREVDVIEEILRIYGYNKIQTPEKISFTSVKNSERDAQKVENAAAQILLANGFHEAMNNSVIKSDYQSDFDLNEKEGIRLLNPLSSDLVLMRQSMLPGLLENTAYNINRKINNIKLFEFGKVYKKTGDFNNEFYRLAVLLSGNKKSENWAESVQKTNFFMLKGLVTETLYRLGIREIAEKPFSDSNISEGIELKSGKKSLGYLGIVNKKLLKKMDVPQEVFYAEINWDTVTEAAIDFKLEFKDISKFPPVKRDLALLIDKNITYAELFASVKVLKQKLIKSIQLFDVYEGDKLPQGKKSYAMSFILQDEQKTLNDNEIDKVMNKLIENFKKKFDAELRD